jgi:hypothetical protein
MKWRCSAQAGGVEESKFCLFSVVFPVRCISSVSPRFYFRRHAFCFLSLAAILDSPQRKIIKWKENTVVKVLLQVSGRKHYGISGHWSIPVSGDFAQGHFCCEWRAKEKSRLSHSGSPEQLNTSPSQRKVKT